MIIEGREQTCIEHYLKRKFFIRPFVCSCCGNKIMLEHGYVVKTGFKYKLDYLSPIVGIFGSFDIPDKICEICSKDVIDYLLKTKL